MIPLTLLYDEYIGRPNLTEQEKNPVDYIVPPSPLKWGSEQQNKEIDCFSLFQVTFLLHVAKLKSVLFDENEIFKIVLKKFFMKVFSPFSWHLKLNSGTYENWRKSLSHCLIFCKF